MGSPFDKISGYVSDILGAKPQRSEGAFSRAADSFEDDLLEFDEFPEEYFKFILRLFSESDFYSRPGLWNFLLVLGTEKEKLQESHFSALTDSFREHYGSYTNSDLCLAVCDFIARNYPVDAAKRLLQDLQDIEIGKPENLRGSAAEGFMILEREIARSRQGKH